jgi:hypothetical protein
MPRFKRYATIFSYTSVSVHEKVVGDGVEKAFKYKRASHNKHGGGRGSSKDGLIQSLAERHLGCW